MSTKKGVLSKVVRDILPFLNARWCDPRWFARPFLFTKTTWAENQERAKKFTMDWAYFVPIITLKHNDAWPCWSFDRRLSRFGFTSSPPNSTLSGLDVNTCVEIEKIFILRKQCVPQGESRNMSLVWNLDNPIQLQAARVVQELPNNHFAGPLYITFLPRNDSGRCWIL